MPGELGIIDSGILQFTPKGAYYEGQNEQYNAVKKLWIELFNNDRTLFSLVMLLNGTGFSKGAMTQILLSNPLRDDNKLPVKMDGLPQGFENEIITYVLHKERTPRALKNLLMLTEGNRVNNSRTRKLILEFIFNRSNNDLDFLAVNYKGKLQKLVRHALGKQDLHKVLEGDTKVFQKFIGRYNRGAYPVLCHIFNKDIPSGVYFPMIQEYYYLREAAQKGNIDEFRKHMKKLPIRTVMGMRNLYKVQIDKAELLEKTQTSTKDKIQMQAAAKRTGAKLDVNYEKQDIYDIYKILYTQMAIMEEKDFDKIFAALYKIEKKIQKIDIGECVIIMDHSHSMIGSDQRPMHPFITGRSIISTIKNVKKVISVGGKHVINIKYPKAHFLVPANSTNLWRGLIKAVSTGVKNIIVISDGYENTIKGMFGHVYNHLKQNGYDFKLIHINPVFSAGSSEGTTKRLVNDIKPLPVGNYKYLETEVIFSKLLEDKELVIKLLVEKYKNLLR